MKNAIKRHDIKTDDLPIEPESTWLNPGIHDIKELKDWVLTSLGYPLVTVELTDSQLNLCVSDALSLYSKYAYRPVKYLIVNTKFYKHSKFPNDPDAGIDLHEFSIMSIKDISFQRDNLFGITGSDMFYSPYAFFGQGVGSPAFGLGSQSYVGTWTTYHNIHEWFDVTKRMMGSNPDWSYDKHTKILKLMPEPKNNGKDEFILLTCNQEPPLEEYYGNEYVRRITLAKAKILLGTIRKKFSSVQLIGGGTIDTTIGDEGKEELNTVLENIIKDESCGQCCYIA